MGDPIKNNMVSFDGCDLVECSKCKFKHSAGKCKDFCSGKRDVKI